MPPTTLLVDLDDTLYPSSCGLWDAVKDRIHLYMDERLGIDQQAIDGLRLRLYQEYGTTLRGLQAEFQVDVQDYLAFIHDVPVRQYLQPDLELRRMLESLACRKLIFTNADKNHAFRVTEALGLDGCFDGLVDINAMAPYCKPMPQTFEIALRTAGEADPAKCVLIDDLPRVTRAAREFGFFSVLIGKEEPHPDADAVIMNLIDLPKVLPGDR